MRISRCQRSEVEQPRQLATGRGMFPLPHLLIAGGGDPLVLLAVACGQGEMGRQIPWIIRPLRHFGATALDRPYGVFKTAKPRQRQPALQRVVAEAGLELGLSLDERKLDEQRIASGAEDQRMINLEHGPGRLES